MSRLRNQHGFVIICIVSHLSLLNYLNFSLPPLEARDIEKAPNRHPFFEFLTLSTLIWLTSFSRFYYMLS